jgi:hypothetical protein
MKFTLNGATLNTIVKTANQKTENYLNSLTNGVLLTTEELAVAIKRPPTTLRSDLFRYELHEYTEYIVSGKRMRVWGNKKTIIELRKELNAHNS